MPDRVPLLYVGPNESSVQSLIAEAGFTELISSRSTTDAVNVLRERGHAVPSALFDSAIRADQLEEVTVYLKQAFPEVVIAIVGDVEPDERRRLELLGVSVFLDSPIQADSVRALLEVAARMLPGQKGARDWSVKVEGEDWVEITVPSREEYVSRIQELVNMLERSKLDQDTRDELTLAIDELVHNAMEWGNRYEEDRRVLVSYYCAPDRIVLKVEDEGSGFDVSQLDNPTVDLGKHSAGREKAGKRPGGFGIHLIRNLMDEVIYNDPGNVVMLTKFLPQAGDA